MVAQRFRQEGIDVLVEHKAKAFQVENGEKILVAEHDGKDIAHRVRRAARARSGASRQHAGLRARGARHPGHEAAHGGDRTSTCRPSTRTSTPAATSRGPTSSRTPPRTRRGTAAVNALFGALQEVPRRLLGDPVGDVHRPRGGARRPERDRGEGEGHRLRGHDLRHRRPRSRDRRRRGAHGLVKVLTVPGKDKILGVTIVGEHAGDLIVEYVAAMQPRHRPEQDPRHDPHLSDASPKPTSTPPACGSGRTRRRGCCSGSSASTPGCAVADRPHRRGGPDRAAGHWRTGMIPGCSPSASRVGALGAVRAVRPLAHGVDRAAEEARRR